MIERVISSVETIGRRRSGRAYGIFFIAFLLFVVVLAILSHLGLPDGAIGTLFIFVIGAVALIGAVLGRTMQLGEFFLANRDVSAAQ